MGNSNIFRADSTAFRWCLTFCVCLTLLQTPLPVLHAHSAYESTAMLSQHVEQFHHGMQSESESEWHWHFYVPGRFGCGPSGADEHDLPDGTAPFAAMPAANGIAVFGAVALGPTESASVHSIDLSNCVVVSLEALRLSLDSAGAGASPPTGWIPRSRVRSLLCVFRC